MLNVLSPVIPISETDVFESINKLNELRTQIYSKNLSESNPSIELANWLPDIPIIYYPWGLQAAAIRFKNSLQENSKQHAISEDVIEACHNRVVPWKQNKIVKPILIQGEDDYIKTKERWKILKEFFIENNIEFKEVSTVKGNILSKIICLIYLFDYTSIYRAIIQRIDPTPVKAIDFIKKKL